MAYAMTKQGSLDNCVTYEFICDTIADMNAIENRYRSIGSVAIVLQGESEGLEVYIAGSDKNWNSLSGAGADSSATGGLSIYICGQDEVDELTGFPDVEEPDETSIYLVPATEESGNLYDEYIYVDNDWEKFGSANIDLSNYIQKTDIATQSTAGLVKVLDNGNVTFNENNQLVLTLAGTAVVKSGQSDHPISVTHQHEAAFYGLAKAAGQDMKNSGNAVGTYTTEAASAIRTMIGAGTYTKPAGGIPANDLAETYLTQHQDISGLYTKPASGIPASDLAETYLTQHQDISGLAPKANPQFTGSISLGRDSHTTVGDNSIAIGDDAEASNDYAVAFGVGAVASGPLSFAQGEDTTASGDYSSAIGSQSVASGSTAHAEGQHTTASGSNSHSEGNVTTASGNSSHSEGSNTTAAGSYSHAQGSYTQAARAYQTVAGKYNVIETGSATTAGTYAEIIGNGTGTSARSNARALDWSGNEYLDGDLYVNCAADSTGGSKVATETYVNNHSQKGGSYDNAIAEQWIKIGTISTTQTTAQSHSIIFAINGMAFRRLSVKYVNGNGYSNNETFVEALGISATTQNMILLGVAEETTGTLDVYLKTCAGHNEYTILSEGGQGNNFVPETPTLTELEDTDMYAKG